jgi:hypothetical protein
MALPHIPYDRMCFITYMYMSIQTFKTMIQIVQFYSLRYSFKIQNSISKKFF